MCQHHQLRNIPELNFLREIEAHRTGDKVRLEARYIKRFLSVPEKAKHSRTTRVKGGGYMYSVCTLGGV